MSLLPVSRVINVVSSAVFDHPHHHSYTGDVLMSTDYSAWDDTFRKPIPGIRNGFPLLVGYLAETRVLKRDKMSDKLPFYGRQKSSRPPPTPHVTSCVELVDSLLIDIPTATSDAKTETGLA